MQKPFERQPPDDAPLYIRWNPDRAPYAIELKLDLVPRILEELDRGERRGVEIGGVLIGSLPEPYMPTLRIEEIEIVPRLPGDGAVYMLDPAEHDRFSQVRWKARARDRAALGFFRSHLRPGTLKLSLADRSLLAGEFKQDIVAVLLIEGRSPHTAAFFLSANGQLPNEPSVREFRFDEAEFRSLPEVPGDAPLAQEPAAARPPRSKMRTVAVLAALLLIGVVACALMWSFSAQPLVPDWLHGSSRLQLAVAPRGRLLRISWNHAARELSDATAATLVVTDGAQRREYTLGLDELRLGAVEYQRLSPQVQITMTVTTPNAASPTESVQWPQR